MRKRRRRCRHRRCDFRWLFDCFLAVFDGFWSNFDAQAMLEVDPEDEGDSREERAFRSWFNSLNIDREVLDLYDQIGDGIILLQVRLKGSF